MISPHLETSEVIRAGAHGGKVLLCQAGNLCRGPALTGFVHPLTHLVQIGLSLFKRVKMVSYREGLLAEHLDSLLHRSLLVSPAGVAETEVEGLEACLLQQGIRRVLYHFTQPFLYSGCKVNKKGEPGQRGSFCGSVSLHCARLRLAPFRGTDPQKQSIPSLPFSIGNQGG